MEEAVQGEAKRDDHGGLRMGKEGMSSSSEGDGMERRIRKRKGYERGCKYSSEGRMEKRISIGRKRRKR